jgi:hypothetical protein
MLLLTLLLSLVPIPLPAQSPGPSPDTPAPAGQVEPGLVLELPPGPVARTLAAPGAAEALAEHRARRAEQRAAGHLPAAWAGLPSWTPGPGLTAWDDTLGWWWWHGLLADERAELAFVQRPVAYDLAQVARAQGRDLDVWRHLADLPVGDLQDALQVLLLGHDPALQPDGPLLVSPLLPPEPEWDRATWQGLPPLRAYVAQGLRVGTTTLTLSVEVPPEGVEVRLRHEAGPALELDVHLAVPPDREKSLEYVDWERIDDPPQAHRVRLVPGGEEVILWARCLPQDLPWPRLSPGVAFPTERSIRLETTPDDPAAAQLAQLAAVLDDLLPTAVSLSTEPHTPAAPPGTLRAPLVIDLRPGPRRLDKLRAILSQVEAQVLDGRQG